MRLTDLSTKLLGLAKVLHAWLELITGLETSRRQRISIYADEIAATLKRAANALSHFDKETEDSPALRQASRDLGRELGRISGYVEDIVILLEDQLDGRKLAGVKRRLETIAEAVGDLDAVKAMANHHLDRLSESEGYFRALADGLRL